MNRGIVMQVAGRYCVVMSPDGSFQKILRPASCRVGEEIAFDIPARRFRPFRPVWITAAAAILILALAMPRIWPANTAYAEVAAYVAMDINPSLEMGIGEDERVLVLTAYNAEGQSVIRGLAYKGQPAEKVAAAIIDRVQAGGYLAAEGAGVVITSVLVADNASGDFEDNVARHVDEAVLAALADTAASRRQAPVAVTVLSAPKELLEASRPRGVSPGKLAVYLLAKNEGADVKLDAIKAESIEKAAEPLGGVAAVVGAEADRKANKEKLKQLYEAEKEKLKEDLKHDRTDDSKSGRNKSVNKGQKDQARSGSKDDGNVGGGNAPAPAAGNPKPKDRPVSGNDDDRKDAKDDKKSGGNNNAGDKINLQKHGKADHRDGQGVSGKDRGKDGKSSDDSKNGGQGKEKGGQGGRGNGTTGSGDRQSDITDKGSETPSGGGSVKNAKSGSDSADKSPDKAQVKEPNSNKNKDESDKKKAAGKDGKKDNAAQEGVSGSGGDHKSGSGDGRSGGQKRSGEGGSGGSD